MAAVSTHLTNRSVTILSNTYYWSSFSGDSLWEPKLCWKVQCLISNTIRLLVPTHRAWRPGRSILCWWSYRLKPEWRHRVPSVVMCVSPGYRPAAAAAAGARMLLLSQPKEALFTNLGCRGYWHFQHIILVSKSAHNVHMDTPCKLPLMCILQIFVAVVVESWKHSPATRTSEQLRCAEASLLLHPGWQLTSVSRPCSVQVQLMVAGCRLGNVFWPHYKWVSSTITTTTSGDSGQCLCRHHDICTDIPAGVWAGNV